MSKQGNGLVPVLVDLGTHVDPCFIDVLRIESITRAPYDHDSTEVVMQTGKRHVIRQHVSYINQVVHEVYRNQAGRRNAGVAPTVTPYDPTGND